MYNCPNHEVIAEIGLTLVEVTLPGSEKEETKDCRCLGSSIAFVLASDSDPQDAE